MYIYRDVYTCMYTNRSIYTYIYTHINIYIYIIPQTLLALEGFSLIWYNNHLLISGFLVVAALGTLSPGTKSKQKQYAQ